MNRTRKIVGYKYHTIIKKNKSEGQTYNLTFSTLTKGQVLAIYNALTKHSVASIVAEDIVGYMNTALLDSHEPSLEDIRSRNDE